MPRTRSLEIWHIPKRQNIHQIIGAVEILSQDDFNGKSWTSMRQENFNTKLGRCGLTNTGRPLSPSARRTLEALMKYLGFIFIDNTTTPPSVNVTNAGFELLKKHGSVLNRRRNLRLVYQNKEEIIESPIVEHQMNKLQITNPVIREDCVNILLFPFRITLRLLLELGKLTKEELGYIVFSMKSEDEYDLIVEKINTFRSLPDNRKNAEIEAFKKTELGNLTLVQAPTATYYMGLCVGTGLCEKNGDELLIRQDKVAEVEKILKKFSGIKPFDFADNLRLWIDYYGNVEKLRPPLLVNIKCKKPIYTYVRVSDTDDKELERGVISKEKSELNFPLFLGQKYKFEFFSFSNAQKIHEEIVEVKSDKLIFDPKSSQEAVSKWDEKSINAKILDLIQHRDFDAEYLQHLEVVKKITKKDNFNTSLLRGGRLEYLFYRLLSVLKEKGTIDDVVWNGHLDDFGLAYPAPGGKEGYPDVYFFVGKNLFVLELTTIRSNSMQWAAEGASVHDHIMNLIKRVNGNYNVIGLFSAPVIAPRVENMFAHISAREKIPHKVKIISELLDEFKKGRDGLNGLIENKN
ncbi:MAG: AlwI family type II restriction endonuclease [Actinomycetota bacterium]|nr:AlwI family type II restriction endonuclease [Actinomycetota bacterium]